MSVRQKLIDALIQKYKSDIADGIATITVYLENPVGIGEHPQHLDELDKLVTKISNAKENLDTIAKHFDDNEIPF
jgi:methylaspartate ammonia-lyase|tara:strand:+ start:272 stop:496 length:225 start_codon:yes stop_codon:yes gene_type:complete